MENAKIAAALVKAQRAFSPALKTSTNPHFKNRYAALDACIDAVLDALNEAGIFLSQPTHESAAGVLVETVFLHESGESFSAGKLFVPAGKNDAQGYGSALTYARRYSLMSACGIAPEDDDGNHAARAPQDVAASIIEAMREAALQGPDALQAAFKQHSAAQGFKAWWASERDNLKKAAANATANA